MEMTLFDRYCSPDHFGTSFVFFRLTMNKRRFKRLFKLATLIHFEINQRKRCCQEVQVTITCTTSDPERLSAEKS